LALDHFLVAENLKRRTIVATAWQTQMNATKCAFRSDVTWSSQAPDKSRSGLFATHPNASL
jgi:hypothetical protein